MGILERIADIENEINRTQKNKGKKRRDLIWINWNENSFQKF